MKKAEIRGRTRRLARSLAGAVIGLGAGLGVLLTGCGAGNSAAGSSASGGPAAQMETAAAADSMPEAGAYENEREGIALDKAATGQGEVSSGLTGDAAVPAGNAAESGRESGVSRKLIRDVTMEVETRNFDGLLERISERVEELGGYVESSSVSGRSLNSDGTGGRDASVKARIPADRLDGFVETVEEEANVLNRQEQVTDITLQYSDVESRKKSLEIEQERLWELLEQAESVDAVVTLESRLSQVRYELESLTSQLRLYDNQVAYSTVDLYIWEVGELTPQEEEGIGARIQRGFSDSVKMLTEGGVDLMVWILSNSPVLLVLAAAAFILAKAGRIGLRLRRKRREKKALGKAVPDKGENKEQ